MKHLRSQGRLLLPAGLLLVALIIGAVTITSGIATAAQGGVTRPLQSTPEPPPVPPTAPAGPTIPPGPTQPAAPTVGATLPPVATPEPPPATATNSLPETPTAVANPPRPPSEQARSSDSSAVIGVGLRVLPGTVARPNSLITYAVVVKNLGKGNSHKMALVLPINPRQLKPANVSIENGAGWVRQLLNDAIEIELEKIGSGEVVTVNVQFVVLPTVAANERIDMVATAEWNDRAGDGKTQSNLISLTVGQDAPTLGTLKVEANGNLVFFSGENFAPSEPVSFWYDNSAGASTALNTLEAEADGTLEVVFDTTGLVAGRYTLVARGDWSGWTATGVFEVR